MRDKGQQPNIDNSDLINFPNGRIKNNDGSGNGTPINEQVKGDVHEFFDKMLRLYGINHNGLPDNEANGYQSIEALKSIASKNDFILTITSTTGILSVPVKLGKMLENEQIVCKASISKTTETEIKGSDNSQFVVVFVGDFKANEYVRLIKTASGVIIVRLVDLVNLDLAVSEFLYLKKGSQVQEDSGATELVATTPLTNKTVFEKRVNDDVLSAPFLATISKNGIYPKGHFSIVENIGSPPIRNVGWFSGLNVGVSVGSLPIGGDVTSATIFYIEGGSSGVNVTMNNAMDDLNYRVDISVESQGVISSDLDAYSYLFIPISTTQFKVGISKLSSDTTNLKIHLSVVQLT